MINLFKSGKMASNIIDSALANGKGKVDIIDGALVVLGGLDKDSAVAGENEYDTYDVSAPSDSTAEVAIVDYAGVSEGRISGNEYKIGAKLYGLTVSAGTIMRVRRLALHDKFWLGDGNFSSAPAVGEYAVASAGSFLHAPASSLPKKGYAVKVLASEAMTAGMAAKGKIYLCEVMQLGEGSGKDLLNATPTEQAAYLIGELKGTHSMSDYVAENADAILKSLGISKDDATDNIAKNLYNKLQGGETLSATMSDGAVFGLSGNFSDETGQWKMLLDLKLPEIASGAAFPKGSGYTVKGGSIKVTLDPAEATSYDEYGGCLVVYSYSVDVTGVTVNNGVKDFMVDIKGLKRPEDTDNPDGYAVIIDPSRYDWTIKIHDFKLPEADAEGTVKIDGKSASWKDIKSLLE